KLLEIETDLRFAFERNEFVLYYQPIIDLDAMELAGFEALVRWNHPCRGLVTPQEFISVAEASGLIQPITIKLLRSAC
nr:EAL domain-containing protein [Escherichia coli]